MQTEQIPQQAKDIESQTQTSFTKADSPSVSYTDINTNDVILRVKGVFKPFKADFMNAVQTNPDWLGPFWVSATIVIILTMLIPMNGGSYSILTLPSMILFVYSFSFGAPAILGLIFRLIGAPDVGFGILICLFGYSVSVLIPVLIIAILPTWTVIFVLIYGLINSLIFLIWNVQEDLARATQQIKYMMIGCIVVSQLVFYGILCAIVL